MLTIKNRKSNCENLYHTVLSFWERKAILCVSSIFLLSLACRAQHSGFTAGQWGDQLNGTYKNPVVNADYSDPDVIRVGEYYYMVCSEFHFMGMTVLRSRDLVNWTIVSRVYNRLDIDPKYNTMEKYGSGSWAPAIRYHNKKFYIYFCTPDEGLYMTSTYDPAGKWLPLTEIKRTGGWEDPCPFWDDDGQAYLGHSMLGGGPIIIHKMNEQGTRLLDEGKLAYEGPTAEGTKFYKKNGYYYIVIPEGGVGTGYQTALRSKNIYGPYERKIVLEQGKTAINGPHQGGMVEAKDGKWWFMHFQAVGALGRVCHLQPVKWIDDWPFIGVDLDGNGIGEPVTTWAKPNFLPNPLTTQIQTSDEFKANTLALQWQWNHNPVNSAWSLSKHKGYIALDALYATDNKSAKNTLTQKLMGAQGKVTTLMRTDLLEDGQKSGMCLIGGNIFEIGVVKAEGKLRLFANHNGAMTYGPYIQSRTVQFRTIVNLKENHTVMQYSIDGVNFKQLGKECELSGSNYWKAVRPALFSYNTSRQAGTALFDWFQYQHDGVAGDLQPKDN